MSDATPEGTPAVEPAVPGSDPADAAPVAGEPANDQPSAPETGGEFDIASLPPEAQEYIRELRSENKDWRKKYEPYKNAFSHFPEAEQNYLVDLVDVLGTNQEAGAQAMYELSQRLLGIEAEGQAVTEDPVVQEEAEAAGLDPEAVKNLVRQEIEQEQQIAKVEAETRSLGFEPGTPEANKLWDLAIALGEPDLSKVAPIARQALGLPDPAAQEAPAEPAPEPEPEPAAQFPATAGHQGGSGGTNAEDRPAPPPINSDEMRERVRRRILAEAGQ